MPWREGRAGRVFAPALLDMPSQAQPVPLQGLEATGPRAGLSFALWFHPLVSPSSVHGFDRKELEQPTENSLT